MRGQKVERKPLFFEVWDANKSLKRKKRIDKFIDIAIANLTKWSSNITKSKFFYKDKFDPVKNVNNLCYYIEEKIKDYLSEIESRVDFWTYQINEETENSEEYAGIKNEATNLISIIHEKCKQTYSNLMDSLKFCIFSNYPPENIDLSLMDSSEKEEKQQQGPNHLFC